MGKIMYIVSFVLFAADLGTDIYVAVKHRENGDEGWFAWTLVFTVIPLVISFLAPCYAKKLYEVRDIGDTLVIARYMEAMYESAPQWCLQVYIMLLKWEFPWYTILSTVFSLLGLTWSTIDLERKILEDEYDNWLFLVVSFLHELSGFISRLVVIAVFAYAFMPFFFVFGICCSYNSPRADSKFHPNTLLWLREWLYYNFGIGVNVWDHNVHHFRICFYPVFVISVQGTFHCTVEG
ncbi:XK-related protein 6-like [Dendronephthya gigantea]|uniref:XK-related protein 6-like n=1 Tax=Dendronephthya gigantea TaxID=151771 RepID=UPI00106D9E37|nr:XK-related protein 6-like [Dendronephthya gigantea]